MGFEILIETMAIEDRIVKMMNTLQTVPVPAELTAWQVDDMKRKHPNTEILNPTAAITRIWPRGRTQAQRSALPQRRRTVRAAGKHPILRPVLLNKLEVRMQELLRREVKW
jgi:hypothetical protein